MARSHCFPVQSLGYVKLVYCHYTYVFHQELLEKRTKLMKEYSEYRKRREDLMRDRKSIFLEGREQCTLTLQVYGRTMH